MLLIVMETVRRCMALAEPTKARQVSNYASGNFKISLGALNDNHGGHGRSPAMWDAFGNATERIVICCIRENLVNVGQDKNRHTVPWSSGLGWSPLFLRRTSVGSSLTAGLPEAFIAPLGYVQNGKQGDYNNPD